MSLTAIVTYLPRIGMTSPFLDATMVARMWRGVPETKPVNGAESRRWVEFQITINLEISDSDPGARCQRHVVVSGTLPWTHIFAAEMIHQIEGFESKPP